MITHTVLMRLTRPVDPAARARVSTALERFAAAPPHAVGPAQVIEDAGLRQEGRSVTEFQMIGTFADDDAFTSYLADPAHLALVEEVFIPNFESWLSLQHRS